MARSRYGDAHGDENLPDSRSGTIFQETSVFISELTALGLSNVPTVRALILRFQTVYQASRTNADIPPGYRFRQLDKMSGQYSLWKIHLSGDYRAAIVFADRPQSGQAFMLRVWKKSGQKDALQENRAKELAKRLWSGLQKG